MDKEKRGIYNVSFNKKQSTPIDTKLKQELEAIDNTIINYMQEYVVHYVKGWHNIKRDKGRGAEHIKKDIPQQNKSTNNFKAKLKEFDAKGKNHIQTKEKER